MDPPSAFVLDAISRVSRARPVRALDLAMGSGRHAVPLADRGIVTFGVDRDVEKVRAARAAAAAKGLTINAWAADLSSPALPDGFFDLIVCVRFLDRALLPLLPRALRAGGLLIYETFTTGQLSHGRGPRSPDHLLRRGELSQAFPSLVTLAYEEVEEPDAVARLVARREG